MNKQQRLRGPAISAFVSFYPSLSNCYFAFKILQFVLRVNTFTLNNLQTEVPIEVLI